MNSTTEDRLKLYVKGYTPIPAQGKVPVLKGWPAAVVTREVIEAWETEYPRATTTAIRCGEVLAIDLDIDGENLAAQILYLAFRELGASAIRSSRGNRAALFYRTGDAVVKEVTGKYLKDGVEASVEVKGRRCLQNVAGPHSPGHAYAWDRELPPVADLVEVTALQIGAFLEVCGENFEAAGFAQAAPEGVAGGVVKDITPEMVWGHHGVTAELKDECERHGQVRVCMAPVRAGATNPMTGIASVEHGRLLVFDNKTMVQHLEVDTLEEDFAEIGAAIGGGDGGFVWEVHMRRDEWAQHTCTDLANAWRVAAANAGNLLYYGSWFTWGGKQWKRGDTPVHKLVKNQSQLILREVAALARAAGPGVQDQIDRLNKWSAASESAKSLAATETIMRKLLAQDYNPLNRVAYLLNFRNGTVDLRDGSLRAHRKEDYLSHMIELDYDQSARSIAWERTIGEVYGELADFAQRWWGYNATGETREDKMAAHYGTGSNGKSSVVEAIAKVLGPLAVQVPVELLVHRRGGVNEQARLTVGLYGARMATCSETQDGSSLNEAQVKSATGGDTVAGRLLYKEMFEFQPTHALNLVTNHRPEITGTDNGIWRRILLIPYKARFGTPEAVAMGDATHVQDSRLRDSLKQEGPAVAAWLVQGARRWYADGLQVPKSVLDASNAYRTEQDRIGLFFAERIERAPDDYVVLSGYAPGDRLNIYTMYKAWCEGCGIFATGRSKFKEEFLRFTPGKEWVKQSRSTVLHGFRYVDHEEEGREEEKTASLGALGK